jgi:DNA polymerase III epsilon subunit-like protein
MFIFIDTETTGTGPEDRLCQIAFKPEGGPAVCQTFNPGRPISIDAMPIHHITNRMVQGKPPFRGSDTHAQLQSLIRNDDNVIVAHNARFDVDMLNREGIYPPRVICTLKLARYLDKNGVIPKYNLQYLRYFLNLEIEATVVFHINPFNFS